MILKFILNQLQLIKGNTAIRFKPIQRHLVSMFSILSNFNFIKIFDLKNDRNFCLIFEQKNLLKFSMKYSVIIFTERPRQ